VLAVPVAPPEAVGALAADAEVVVLHTPRDLRAIGEWYADFTQTPDTEVVELLARASASGDAAVS
jgi:predicted phosphoribosyltransferase